MHNRGPFSKKKKTPASGGAPRGTTESPHKAGELAPCWLRGCGVKTREHLQLGCSPSDRRTRSETVQRVQVKGDKLNRGLAPPPTVLSRTAKSRTFIDLVGCQGHCYSFGKKTPPNSISKTLKRDLMSIPLLQNINITAVYG